MTLAVLVARTSLAAGRAASRAAAFAPPRAPPRSLAAARRPSLLRAASSPADAAAPAATDPLYVTTPIYYVNDDPHIGHAYTSVACDALARFARLEGRPTRFVTGTDEHGQKVQASAEARGVAPFEFATSVSARFRELADAYDVSYDRFIRTTDDDHKRAVAALWRRLVERDQIYLGSYEGWYCVRDECFYNDSELVVDEATGERVAPTGAAVEWTAKEPSYFFKLSEWTQPLLDHYAAHPDAIAPAARRNEVVAFLEREGLRDLSVSRTSFSWGVGVPDDDDHVVCVSSPPPPRRLLRARVGTARRAPSPRFP